MAEPIFYDIVAHGDILVLTENLDAMKAGTQVTVFEVGGCKETYGMLLKDTKGNSAYPRLTLRDGDTIIVGVRELTPEEY